VQFVTDIRLKSWVCSWGRAS